MDVPPRHADEMDLMSLTTYEHLEQGTDQWLKARLGMVTASTVGKLIATRTLGAIDFDCPACAEPPHYSCVSKVKKAGETPAPIKTMHPERTKYATERAVKVLEVADNDESRGLTSLLVAERITGWSDPTFMSTDMQRGHDVEPIARDLYSETVAPATELGFMVRDDWGFNIGYSPDGLVGDDGLIEVKAPRSKTHLATILSGEVPQHHMPQIQAGLLVADRDWCDFISFCAGMPPFIKRVHRDERWGAVIVQAVENFEAKAAEMQAEYETRTTGLPKTERLALDNLGLVF